METASYPSRTMTCRAASSSCSRRCSAGMRAAYGRRFADRVVGGTRHRVRHWTGLLQVCSNNSMSLIPRRADFAPHEDYGFFGPDSVTWKVWSYPTSLTIGFQRAVVVEELDPALVASVNETQAIFNRPRTRYDRTLRYFAMVMFGDSRSTAKAADVLVKIHSKGVGVDPVTGKNYDANDPHSQLWIHLT